MRLSRFSGFSPIHAALFSLFLTSAAGPAPAQADEWETDYEKSGHVASPRYDATVAFAKRMAEKSKWIRYESYGESPQGRELPLLIVDKRGNFTPEKVRKTDNVVMLIQAGIHSGEIDGKDAGFMLIRDMVFRDRHTELLDNVTILFQPIFSVDGHERQSPHNRANQNGPESMGWRATAQGYNLNREYMKADAVEMKAWLKLYNAWLPELLADCHVTDGADYQYVMTYALESLGNSDARLSEFQIGAYEEPLHELMAADGFPLVRYCWFRKRHDPKSGIVGWTSPPRFSGGYAAVQNRLGLLVETHMLKPYRERVDGTYAILKNSLVLLDRHHKELKAEVAAADGRAASSKLRTRPFPLAFNTSFNDSVMIDFLGYEYTVEKSDITGGDWHRYSDTKVTFPIPLFHTQDVTRSAMLPVAYVIPPEWTEVIDRLELHGVRMTRLSSPRTVEAEHYRLTAPRWESFSYEGRHRLVEFEQNTETHATTFPAGSAVIMMNQRTGRLIANALEPKAADSFVYWGFFDTVFEQKEYIESYVIEALMREMLANDAELRAEFESKRDAEPEFAENTQAIRNWFYRRSPYWDKQLGLYPVGRIMSEDDADRLTGRRP